MNFSTLQNNINRSTMLNTSTTNSRLTLIAGAAVPIMILFFMLPTSTKAFVGYQIRRPFAAAFGLKSSASSGTAYTDAGMPILPADVVKYSQVPGKDKLFTANKIPKGLLKEHNTKPGTWGVIRVKQGKLQYTILEPEHHVFELDPSVPPGIIEPKKLHQVKALTDDLQFAVEFHRLPGTGPVDEKREGL